MDDGKTSVLDNPAFHSDPEMDDGKTSVLDNPAFHSDPEDVIPGVVQNEADKNFPIAELKVRERDQWTNGLEFTMSCIAMSIGLGNLWRFPFVAYENGGGAFMIPYLIILIVVGRPMYYLEMALGQFGNRGNVRLYSALAPYLKGVALGQVFGSFCISSYYCSILATSMFYFINSFTDTLPWGICQEEWSEYLTARDMICVPASVANKSLSSMNNTISSSELYYTLEVLQEKTDISDGIGIPEWRLTLCLISIWIMVFVISYKGIKSSGKASYFLAIFPYVIMIALFFRAVTLEGAGDGIRYLFEPDWSKLGDPAVWYAAMTQCFFSLDLGSGSLVMYSSYNNFNHNVHRDSLIVVILDTATSLLAGITIFGVLGNLAYNLGVTPDAVISSGGSGLAFISYPDAIAKFNAVPWLFAILFFLMLLVLGVGSMVAMQGNITSVVQDFFPNAKIWVIVLVIAVSGNLVGLMYVTPGGQFMLNLVDHFAGTFIHYIWVLFEVSAIVYLYGARNFCLDVQFMLKFKVDVYTRLMWGLITFIMLGVVFVYFLATLEELTYGQFSYPAGIMAIGWCILALDVVPLIYFIIRFIYTRRGYGFRKVMQMLFSTENWGPNGKIKYEEWKKFKEYEKSKTKHLNRSWIMKQIYFFLGQ